MHKIKVVGPVVQLRERSQTDTQTHRTDNITSSARAGGKILSGPIILALLSLCWDNLLAFQIWGICDYIIFAYKIDVFGQCIRTTLFIEQGSCCGLYHLWGWGKQLHVKRPQVYFFSEIGMNLISPTFGDLPRSTAPKKGSLVVIIFFLGKTVHTSCHLWPCKVTN